MLKRKISVPQRGAYLAESHRGTTPRPSPHHPPLRGSPQTLQSWREELSTTQDTLSSGCCVQVQTLLSPPRRLLSLIEPVPISIWLRPPASGLGAVPGPSCTAHAVIWAQAVTPVPPPQSLLTCFVLIVPRLLHCRQVSFTAEPLGKPIWGYRAF